MIRAVVFDFDGTLVDSNALKRQAFMRLVADDAGGPARMTRLLDTVRGDRRAVIAAYETDRCAPASANAADVDRLVAAYSDAVDAAVAAAPEMPGASALLRELTCAGVYLCLSSATPLENLRRVLDRRGWLPFFDAVAGHPATKTATLQRLLAERGLDATQAAVVGDGEDDRESAQAVGCAFFAVGKARGSRGGETVFTLPELQGLLTSTRPRAAA